MQVYLQCDTELQSDITLYAGVTAVWYWTTGRYHTVRRCNCSVILNYRPILQCMQV